MRLDVLSCASSRRPSRLSLARSSSPSRKSPGRQLAELADDDVDAFAEVVLSRADVDADLAGLGVLRRVAVDAVRHAALLADLLEEPGRGGAAEDRIEDGERVAPIVAARETRAREDDVVLLGRAAKEHPPRLGVGPDRRARSS